MSEREELIAVAQSLLVKVGAVGECPAHDGVFITNYDDEAERRAYAVGTAMVHDGAVDASREEFMSAIKSAIDLAGGECGVCANDRDDK